MVCGHYGTIGISNLSFEVKEEETIKNGNYQH